MRLDHHWWNHRRDPNFDSEVERLFRLAQLYGKDSHRTTTWLKGNVRVVVWVTCVGRPFTIRGCRDRLAGRVWDRDAGVTGRRLAAVDMVLSHSIIRTIRLVLSTKPPRFRIARGSSELWVLTSLTSEWMDRSLVDRRCRSSRSPSSEVHRVGPSLATASSDLPADELQRDARR